MSPREFRAWREFWIDCPFDDEARYFRPFAWMAQHEGAKYDVALRWAKRQADPAGNFGAADLSTFEALGIKPPAR